MPKVLIVEDDTNIAKLVQYNLEKNGLTCLVAASGTRALEIIKKDRVDLILLDIMLPGMDGFEVCKEVRQDPDHAAVPIIMLTARGEEVDRIVGLELGADDYVVKPFSPRELVLRVKAMLKRGKPLEEKESTLHCHKLKVNIAEHEVTLSGKAVELTQTEFNLLVLFLKRAGRVQSREVLLNDVWGIESYIETRTVDTHVKRLRQKLGKFGDRIHTIRGFGYKFVHEEE